MPFLSPATAPIMGGYLTQNASWRWVFWITSIFDLAVQLACFLLLRETHHPTILKNKAKAFRRATGNPNLHTKWQGPDHSMREDLDEGARTAIYHAYNTARPPSHGPFPWLSVRSHVPGVCDISSKWLFYQNLGGIANFPDGVRGSI